MHYHGGHKRSYKLATAKYKPGSAKKWIADLANHTAQRLTERMKQREAKIPPTGKVRMTEALERLVQLDEALEKKHGAAKWRKELEAGKQSQERLKPDNPRPQTSPGTQGK
ncbi:MAG: hypothetical protein ABSG53_03395 [Thermoguttaceae bacterium]|jgi:hypothetical protein